MNNSKLEFIRPESLNTARILSWFSYKNSEYKYPESEIPGLNVGFNSKENQESILGNVHALCDELGIQRSKLALAHQVHGADVQVVEKGGVYESTDGFVTKTPGIGLGIQVADCGAVLLGDFEHQIIGACHAGWRGAVGGIVPHTLDKMMELGADPKTIHAFISPCLAMHNFEVGEEVAEQFPDHLVDRQNYPKPHVDLSGLLINQLLEQGISKDHIEADGRCTIDHADLFYSYRREKDKSGRMLAVIKLNKF